MSQENEIIQKSKNNKDNLIIIEEKVGNTNVTFSEIFNLYNERILKGEETNLFKDDDLIGLDESEKNKFKIQ